MTRIASRWDGPVWHLAVDGHAGYDDGGRDIVCSAISMLCCALAASLSDAPGVDDLTVDRAPGRFHLTAAVAEGAGQARGMIRMAEVGLGMVAEGYGGWVRIEVGDRA